jgi:hydroxymethylglutaryl-CoA lyase
MAGTAEVLRGIERLQGGVHYPVLVPNQRGLQTLLELLERYPAQPFQQPLTDEISVFTATTDSFSRKNLNCTVAESLKKLESVTRTALDKGLRVRGYLSMVIVCPFEGKTDPKRVREVTKQLVDMGCYEVSLGDTVGRGRPHEVVEMLVEVKKDIPVDKLAVSFFPSLVCFSYFCSTWILFRAM